MISEYNRGRRHGREELLESLFSGSEISRKQIADHFFNSIHEGTCAWAEPCKIEDSGHYSDVSVSRFPNPEICHYCFADCDCLALNPTALGEHVVQPMTHDPLCPEPQ